MQIVINIPDEKYKRLPYIDQFSLREYIANGTVLPKGHGRLFDERDIVNGNYEIIGNRLYELEPVIEADNEI